MTTATAKKTKAAVPPGELSHDARRALVRHILKTSKLGTQEDLVSALESHGVRVTQATVSRDLAFLRARRVTLPDGGSVYELGSETTAESELQLAAEMVTAVDDNGTLVVVHTVIGAAPAVAVLLDRSRMDTVLGTIAGDDTIFIAPTRRATTHMLAKHLKSLWRKVS